MSTSIKVLIVDDHQIVRTGLATIIRQEKDMAVAGEACDGQEAVQLAHILKPDVILMDLMMPNKDGPTASAEILSDNPDAKILILTTFGESDEVQKALKAGACGALIKDTPYKNLVSAIRDTSAGKRIISPEIQHSLEVQSRRPDLSERQIEILSLIARGFTNKDISKIVGLSHDGINAHLRAIFSRLNAASRTEAVTIAIQEHLLKI